MQIIANDIIWGWDIIEDKMVGYFEHVAPRDPSVYASPRKAGAHVYIGYWL